MKHRAAQNDEFRPSLPEAGIKPAAANHHGPSAQEIRLASRLDAAGRQQTILSLPTVHCGGCVSRIEAALGQLAGIDAARVNLSTKRITILWQKAAIPPPFVETLVKLGYMPHLIDGETDKKDTTLRNLVRALAVAGFGASNIMILSVSVWSGADPAARTLFHWISAFIALPVLTYSGRIFFRSAWAALKHGQTNMDVPISIGVLLAFGMSFFDTLHGGHNIYFDASVTLLFFLLIGRTLDYKMREQARTAVKGLARLSSRGALVVRPGGGHDYLPLAEIEPGMSILLAAGDRVPVDALITFGASDIDYSLVTGESMPRPVTTGDRIEAGTLNLTGPLTLKAIAAAKDSFLAEMMRLMEAAEAGRSGYRRIADRAARLYAPFVHSAAILAFCGWALATGDIHRAITIAIAVLIITCPCALGLAVPMVQVVAARRLFEQGIMIKDGAALERISKIDTIVFDKTGTLTLGHPQLCNKAAIAPENLALAAAIARHSSHPFSRALVAANASAAPALYPFDTCHEIPGSGLEAISGPDVFRLGRADWALAPQNKEAQDSGLILTQNGIKLEVFQFEEPVREGAQEAISELTGLGYALEMLSGDHAGRVGRMADELGISHYKADVRPAEKTAHITALAKAGHKVLMVGDGLNDAPALTAAYASMAPASAADVGRNAADFVFLRDSLAAVPLTLAVSRQAARLIGQNFIFAAGYNIIALPFAIGGFVTPLIAAVAMSTSSVLVVANALRLNLGQGHPGPAPKTGRTPDHGPLAEKAAGGSI